MMKRYTIYYFPESLYKCILFQALFNQLKLKLNPSVRKHVSENIAEIKTNASFMPDSFQMEASLKHEGYNAKILKGLHPVDISNCQNTNILRHWK